jgi:hypothetical protein
VDAQSRVSGNREVEEFTQLWEWLRTGRLLAGGRVVRRPPGEDELGGVFDMLSVPWDRTAWELCWPSR